MRDLGDAPPAEAPRTGAGPWRRLMQWLFRVPGRPGHARRLSDQLLRDIGLTRAQAHALFGRHRDPRL